MVAHCSALRKLARPGPGDARVRDGRANAERGDDDESAEAFPIPDPGRSQTRSGVVRARGAARVGTRSRPCRGLLRSLLRCGISAGQRHRYERRRSVRRRRPRVTYSGDVDWEASPSLGLRGGYWFGEYGPSFIGVGLDLSYYQAVEDSNFAELEVAATPMTPLLMLRAPARLRRGLSGRPGSTVRRGRTRLHARLRPRRDRRDHSAPTQVDLVLRRLRRGRVRRRTRCARGARDPARAAASRCSASTVTRTSSRSSRRTSRSRARRSASRPRSSSSRSSRPTTSCSEPRSGSDRFPDGAVKPRAESSDKPRDGCRSWRRCARA